MGRRRCRASGVSHAPKAAVLSRRMTAHNSPPFDTQAQGGADGELQRLLRIELMFKRKKGEVFAVYEFGTGLTPDSDEAVRLGTLAQVRLLLRVAAPRACYARVVRNPRTCTSVRTVHTSPTDHAC